MNIWKISTIVTTGILAVSFGCQGAQARTASSATQIEEHQPNMEAALSHLRDARAALDRAEHDKGGWRAKAIDATNVAIRETERGIAFDNKH